MQVPGLRYEGPIYRPPSEAHSLLVQATIGCPHNRCTFCMVYKRGPRFSIRPVEEIKEDLRRAGEAVGDRVRTVFFPAGNTIAMKTDDLVEICNYTRKMFPAVERITVYGSAQYICRKGAGGMKKLADAGLSRIHVGLESGDDTVLERIGKGSTAARQVEAGRLTMAAGIELNLYVMLGIGGKERSGEHIAATVDVLNRIDPDCIRLRTFLPKMNTPILDDIEEGRFQVLSPHEVLGETRDLIRGLDVTSVVASDHYTNYIDVHGRLPGSRDEMLAVVKEAMLRDERYFRPVYVGTQ